MLPVSAPFHCSLLVGAGEKLGHELENVEFSDMNIPVITNVTADYVAKKEDIAPLLVKQVSSSVRWEESVRRMLADGVDTFIAGGAVGFDMLAAQSVLALRHDYEISLRLYIPYRGHTSGWHEEDREEFVELLPKADSVLYVSENYFRGCMRKRNEAMVRDSDCGIAWCERGASGTLQTVSIAKKRGIVVRNIYSE